MISKRTLEKWRREALHWKYVAETFRSQGGCAIDEETAMILYDRVIRLTGDLLDQHLLRKELSK